MTISLDYSRIEALLGSTPSIDHLHHYAEAALAVVAAKLSGTGQTDAVLTMIAEHLAAHYLEVGTGQAKSSERLPDYSVSYATTDLSNLRSTRNGRIAAELDASGVLGEMSKPRPSFAVL